MIKQNLNKKTIFYAAAAMFLAGNFAKANNAGQEKEKTAHWRREFSLGANKSSGNTSNEQVIFKLFINRKTYGNEFTTMTDGGFVQTHHSRIPLTNIFHCT